MARRMKRNDICAALSNDNLNALVTLTDGYSPAKLMKLIENESLLIEICHHGHVNILRYLLQRVLSVELSKWDLDSILKLLCQCNDKGDNVIMQCVRRWRIGDKCHNHNKSINGKRLKCLQLLAESLFGTLMRGNEKEKEKGKGKEKFYQFLKHENKQEFNIFVLCCKECNYQAFELLVLNIYGNERKVANGNGNGKEERLIDLLSARSKSEKKSFVSRMKNGEYKRTKTRLLDQACFEDSWNHWWPILKDNEQVAMASSRVYGLNRIELWQYLAKFDRYLTIKSIEKPREPKIDAIWLDESEEKEYEMNLMKESEMAKIKGKEEITDQVIETRTKDGSIIAELTIFESRMACLMNQLNGYGGKYVYISGFNQFWPKTDAFVREKFLFARILRLGQEKSKDHVSVDNNDGIGQFRKYVYCSLSKQICLTMSLQLSETQYSENEPIINLWSFVDYAGKFQRIDKNDETKSDDIKFEQKRRNDCNIIMRHNDTCLKNGIKSSGEMSYCILEFVGMSHNDLRRCWLYGALAEQLTQDAQTEIGLFSMISS